MSKTANAFGRIAWRLDPKFNKGADRASIGLWSDAWTGTAFKPAKVEAAESYRNLLGVYEQLQELRASNAGKANVKTGGGLTVTRVAAEKAALDNAARTRRAIAEAKDTAARLVATASEQLDAINAAPLARVDKADAAGALRREAIRQRLERMPREELRELLSQANQERVDPAIVDAVLEMPKELSPVLPLEYDRFAEARRREYWGEGPAIAQRQLEAAAVLDAAADAARAAGAETLALALGLDDAGNALGLFDDATGVKVA